MTDTDETRIAQALETLLQACAHYHAIQTDDPLVLPRGARDTDWPDIEAAFADFGVPFDPALKTIYARTLAVENPHSDQVLMPLPFVGAYMESPEVDAPDLESFMDELHLWPREDMLEDDGAFAFVSVANAFHVALSVDQRGLWSVEPYESETPEPADFKYVLADAFEVFVARAIQQLQGDKARECGNTTLIEPRDLSAVAVAEVKTISSD